MSKQDIGYTLKKSLPNKLIQDDGTITDIAGQPVLSTSEAYDTKPALPNKFLNPDGSYSTLNEIIASMIDTELFIVVDELPETGEENKIYLLVQDDKLIEYIWINNAWDPVGMVEFDITNYYTKSEITELLAGVLSAAKEYADNNFLKKNNTTEYTPTADYHPATKKYVDDSIGDMDPQVFYWEGTTKGASTIALWQEIVDANKEHNIIVNGYSSLIGTGSSYHNVFIVVEKGKIYSDLQSYGVSYLNFSYQLSKSNTNSYTELKDNMSMVSIYGTSTGTVTSISHKSNQYTYNRGNFLAVDYNYSTPYTPQYDGSPATKKYVDDSIAASITTALNESY